MTRNEFQILNNCKRFPVKSHKRQSSAAVEQILTSFVLATRRGKASDQIQTDKNTQTHKNVQ